MSNKTKRKCVIAEALLQGGNLDRHEIFPNIESLD